MQEELKDFPNDEYKHRYKVSSLGKIWSITSKIYLKTSISGGHEILSINKNKTNSKIQLRVDEIVAKAFLGESNLYLEHIDGDIKNNSVINLRYIEIVDFLKNKYGNEWKKIKDFDNYFVSNIGEIWSSLTENILNNQLNGGYLRVFIGKQKLIHKLVAEAFIENPKNHSIINHKDGNKTNNHFSNLEWVSFSENSLHSYHVLGNIDNTQSYEKCEAPVDGVELETLKDYIITVDGQIYSKKTCKFLKIMEALDGSYQVEANSKRFRVSRLVAEAYLPEPSEEQKYVIHINGDPKDNNLKNLKWATSSEKAKNTVKNNPNRYDSQKKKVARLDINTLEVLEIYESLSEASKKTKIDKGNIGKVCNGTTNSAGKFKWKYI
jgi:hypothetical protein